MKVLKRIDLFGQKITFRVFNDNMLHTYISVILTLILMVSTSIFTYFQGLDFIFHNESKILQSRRANKEYEFTKLPLNKFFFAWQIQDVEGNNINFTNILYPHLIYISYKNNNSSYISYDKCNKFQEINLMNNLPKDVQDFYCSDIGNFTIGGGWENDNSIEYLNLLIDICENENEKCTSRNDLKIFLNMKGGVYFVLYYPTISFLPEDKTPFQITYNKLNILLNTEFFRYDRFYIEKKIIIDDQGWLLPTYKEKILYDISEIETNYYIHKAGIQDKYNITDNTPVYYFMLYLIQKNTCYKRWFTKAFESLTIIATFFKIIFVIFKYISRICNEFIFYGLIIDSNLNNNKKNQILVFNNNIQKSNISINKSEFNNINIKKPNESESKKENNLSEIRDISLSSLVDKQKLKNRLALFNQNENIPKFGNIENIYNHNNNIKNSINDKNNINNVNNIVNMNNCNLNIYNRKILKKCNNDELLINQTHDIEEVINEMLKGIDNVYKLFLTYVFCRSKRIKTSYNIYKSNRNFLEKKMDVVYYLRLIEKANNIKTE